MRELCLKHPICAILRNVPLEETEDYARAVFEGGVKMFEVALNSDDALSQIILLKKYSERKRQWGREQLLLRNGAG